MEDKASLTKRIQDLEQQNKQLLKKQLASRPGETVKVPRKIKPLFDQARKTVGEYFSHLHLNPEHGTIEIRDQRYVLVRASALSHDFLTTIQQLYADRGPREALSIGKNFLFDIAHVIGVNDAREFHKIMNLTDPIAKLAAGPVHFAHAGWAFVDILPQSKPTPDENFYLIYNHPYSFEADSWLRAGEKSDSPVCIMNAGYSSGWCEESFGLALTAVEVTCKAKGDKNCTFIMSPPHKIKQHLKKFALKSENQNPKKNGYEIPAFFERRKMEEQLALYALIVESSEDAIFSTTMEGIITSWNKSAKKLFGYAKAEIIGKHISLLLPTDRLHEESEIVGRIKAGESITQFETERQKKNGKTFPISITASAIKDSNGQIIGISKIGHDISKRKKAEQALKDLNNRLELLVQERTADLQRAFDELETRVAFRNLELEKTNRANLAKIKALEKQVASLTKKR